MKTVLGIGTAIAGVLLGGAAQASYPCGIYARVHDVKLEGDPAKPTGVKVYGDFILVKTSNRLSEPRRGYMYFSVVQGKEDVCRAEWADLKKLASTDPNAANYVAFGSAHTEVENTLADASENLPNVHKKETTDAKPIPYPLNHGLSRLRVRNAEESDSPEHRNPVILLREYSTRNPLPTNRK